MATKRQAVTIIDTNGTKHRAEIQLSDGDRTDFEAGDPDAVDYVLTGILRYKPHYADLEFDPTSISFDS